MFKHPGITVQGKENLLPGVHLFSDGMFVPAPPSVDQSGDECVWWAGLDEHPLGDMPDKLVHLLARKGLLEDDGRALGVTTESLSGEDEQAPESPTPPAANDNISSSSNHTLPLVRALEIEPEAIDWLWPGVLAKGKLALIVGDPGISKTQLAIRVAATVSNGGMWPASTETAKKANVIYFSAEMVRRIRLCPGSLPPMRT